MARNPKNNIPIPELVERAELVGVTIRLSGGSVDFLNTHRASEYIKRGLEWHRAALTAYLTAKAR